MGTASAESHCYDTAGGKLLWEHGVGKPVRFQPAIARGRVYVRATGGAWCASRRETMAATDG